MKDLTNIKNHVTSLMNKLKDLQKMFIDTKDIPVKILIELRKEYEETQHTLKFVSWLHDEVEFENKNTDKAESKIITM